MITTNSKCNFSQAENDNFVWSDSWYGQIKERASGRMIYVMHWVDTKQPVEPEIQTAAKAFLTELAALRATHQGKHAPLAETDEQLYNEHEDLMRRMDDPNSDL